MEFNFKTIGILALIMLIVGFITLWVYDLMRTKEAIKIAPKKGTYIEEVEEETVVVTDAQD